MEIRYEWCKEEVDENQDIIDSIFEDKLCDLKNHQGHLLLVRNEGSEDEGLTDRFWAYVKDNKLPEYFSDDLSHEVAIKVPQKYHKEYATQYKHKI